jgi:hypothetical protein
MKMIIDVLRNILFIGFMDKSNTNTKEFFATVKKKPKKQIF